MSYRSAKKELSQGISSEKKAKVQQILHKSKELQRRISQTKKEISSELSQPGDEPSDGRESAKMRTAVYEPESAEPQECPPASTQIAPVLQRDPFILQSAKMQLDALESQYAVPTRRKHGKHGSRGPHASHGPQGPQSTPGAIITSIQPQTDSDGEYYTADSVVIFIQSVQFLSTGNCAEKPFELQFTAELDGLAQQVQLFRLTEKSPFDAVPNESTYILNFQVNHAFTLQYLENSALTIKCQGSLGSSTIMAAYRLPQFMKGAFGQRFPDQNAYILKQTELLYDNYFQQQMFQGQTFDIIIDKERIGDCQSDALLQRWDLLPLALKMTAFVCPTREEAVGLQNDSEQLVQNIKKLRFNEKIVENNEAASGAAKAVECDDELLEKEQYGRLEQVDNNLYFDSEERQYFVKVGDNPAEERNTAARGQQEPQEEYYEPYQYNPQREPPTFQAPSMAEAITTLSVEAVELDCLPEQYRSIASISLLQDTVSYRVAENMPIAAGHALITRVTNQLVQSQHEVSPLFVKIVVQDSVEEKLLTGCFTLEELANCAVCDKFITTEPFGRLRLKIAALPPICGRKIDFLDQNYKRISTRYNNSVPQEFAFEEKIVPNLVEQQLQKHPQLPLELKNVEMPDFESDLDQIISELEDCSANVTIGHESFDNKDLEAAQNFVKQVLVSVKSENPVEQTVNEERKEDLQPQIREEKQNGKEDAASLLNSSELSQIEQIIASAKLSPVRVIKPEESSSDADNARKPSHWARQQAKKIFGEDFSESSSGV